MLSVIVPTSGNVPAIHETLQSLCGIDVPTCGAEVAVVQNGLLNATLAEEVESLGRVKNGLRFSFHHTPVVGLLAGRHLGMQVAKGDVLIFIDDDVSVDQAWLRAIALAFKDDHTHLVGGRNIPRYEVAPPDWLQHFWIRERDGRRWCGFLSLLDFGNRVEPIDPAFVWGLNFAIRRETLVAVGGFHPDGVPWEMRRFRGDGESGLAAKIKQEGFRAIYQPDAEVTHIVPASRLTIEYFEKRAYLQGISESFSQLRAKHFQPTNSPQSESRGPSIMRQMAGRIKRAVFGGAMPTVEKQRVSRSYQAGFDYHQAEFDRDESLRWWVLRNDYWDYRYPEAI